MSGRADPSLEIDGARAWRRDLWPAERWRTLIFAIAGPLLIARATRWPWVAALAIVGVAIELAQCRLAPRPQRLRIDASGLTLDGQLRIPRAGIEGASLLGVEGESVDVRVHRRWRRAFDVRFSSLDAARAVRDALGAAPIEFAVDPKIFPNRSPGCLVYFLVSLAGPVIGNVISAAVPRSLQSLVTISVLAIVLPALFASHRYARPRGRIGPEGIALRHGRTRRLIPLADIAAVEVIRGRPNADDPIGLRVRSHAGERIDLVFSGSYKQRKLARARALAHELDDLLDARVDAREASPLDPQTLARGGQPTPAWIASLRALGAGIETFRDAMPATREALARLLEDAGEPAMRRAAAAIALSASGDEDAKKRLRVAAQKTWSPRLRATLEAAQREEDEALCTALLALEDEVGQPDADRKRRLAGGG
jgi:hypothetical protein